MNDEILQIVTSSMEKSATNLNNAYQRFQETKQTDLQDFFEIRLQCCIFQFDVCREMVSVLQHRTSGFSEAVAIKGIVHKLYEYDILVRNSFKRRLLALAEARKIEVDHDALRQLERQSKPALSQLRRWSDVRNMAAGHYHADVKAQVESIESLSFDQVIGVASTFLQYNMGLLIILRDAGTKINITSKI